MRKLRSKRKLSKLRRSTILHLEQPIVLSPCGHQSHLNPPRGLDRLHQLTSLRLIIVTFINHIHGMHHHHRSNMAAAMVVVDTEEPTLHRLSFQSEARLRIQTTVRLVVLHGRRLTTRIIIRTMLHTPMCSNRGWRTRRYCGRSFLGSTILSWNVS